MKFLNLRSAAVSALAVAVIATLPAVASAQTKMILGHSYPASHPQGIAYEWFAEYVPERTMGAINVEDHPAASLVNYREAFDAVKSGTVHAANMTQVFQVGKLPMLNASLVPFIFDDKEHFRRALRNGLFDLFAKEYEKNNIKLMNYFSKGATFIFHKDRFLTKPESYKDQDIRGLGGFMSLILVALGANEVTLPTGEVTTALQRGVVDGIMTSCTAHVARGWSEYTKYVSNVDLAESGEGLGINLEYYNGLSAELRATLQDAAYQMEAIEWYITLKADRKDCAAEWKKRNYPVETWTDADKDAFRKATRSVYDKAKADVPRFAEVEAIIEKTRKKGM